MLPAAMSSDVRGEAAAAAPSEPVTGRGHFGVGEDAASVKAVLYCLAKKQGVNAHALEEALAETLGLAMVNLTWLTSPVGGVDGLMATRVRDEETNLNLNEEQTLAALSTMLADLAEVRPATVAEYKLCPTEWRARPEDAPEYSVQTNKAIVRLYVYETEDVTKLRAERPELQIPELPVVATRSANSDGTRSYAQAVKGPELKLEMSVEAMHALKCRLRRQVETVESRSRRLTLSRNTVRKIFVSVPRESQFSFGMMRVALMMHQHLDVLQVHQLRSKKQGPLPFMVMTVSHLPKDVQTNLVLDSGLYIRQKLDRDDRVLRDARRKAAMLQNTRTIADTEADAKAEINRSQREAEKKEKQLEENARVEAARKAASEAAQQAKRAQQQQEEQSRNDEGESEQQRNDDANNGEDWSEDDEPSPFQRPAQQPTPMEPKATEAVPEATKAAPKKKKPVQSPLTPPLAKRITRTKGAAAKNAAADSS